MSEHGETLLLVDDEPLNIHVLKGIFGKSGYRILTAENGAKALDLARAERPDLILLDVMMPDMSGFDACRELRRDATTEHIPVIFVTCLSEDSHKLEGLDLGAVDYITKPFRTQEVVARVRSHLQFSRRQGCIIDQQAERLGQIQAAQLALLVRPEEIPEARFQVRFLPILEAGGDFYDVIDFGGGECAYFVADISGHDLGASFLTSSLKALFRQHALPGRGTRETLAEMNRILFAITTEETYLTAAYLRVNRAAGTFELCCAGHPPAFASLSGRFAQLGLGGTPVGLFPELEAEPVHGTVRPGDRIYLYTDGLGQGIGGGHATGDIWRDAFAGAVAACSGMGLAEAVAELPRCLLGGSAPKDDVLLLGLEV